MRTEDMIRLLNEYEDLGMSPDEIRDELKGLRDTINYLSNQLESERRRLAHICYPVAAPVNMYGPIYLYPCMDHIREESIPNEDR